MTEKSHSPQDQLYGPLNIPHYCWGIIDTKEFQRLRYISQLGTVHFVYQCANHSRFEHSLGCAHLASTIMDHFITTQPELNIKSEYKEAVVIGALCHDLGHAPFSHLFDEITRKRKFGWHHEEMSCLILKHIHNKYRLSISNETIEAACHIILGEQYKNYPKWLFQIVANYENDIDIDKFDYLSRDMNRTLNISKFEYDRLIIHCKIIDNKLSWKISEIPTIERLFFNRNDMHIRVYKHKVVQSIGCMILDILEIFVDSFKHIEEFLNDPEEFCQYDDRLLYLVENGKFGTKAENLANQIKTRNIYKCIGELRVNPHNDEGIHYSQNPPNKIANDIASNLCDSSILRVIPMSFRYGIAKNNHPLLSIPFWKPGINKIINLTDDDLSCIVPQYFKETVMRVFITDNTKFEQAKEAFNLWKNEIFQKI